ncbi:MAG: Ig-like domain-containing protein [Gemmatimonadaceae bacterium]
MKRLTLLTLCVALVACDSPTPPDTTALASSLANAKVGMTVTIQDPQLEVEVGATLDLQASVINPAGRSVQGTVHWSSSDAEVAEVAEGTEVSKTAVLYARAPGTAVITARLGAFSDSYSLTVLGESPPDPVPHVNRAPIAVMDVRPSGIEDSVAILELTGRDLDIEEGHEADLLRAFMTLSPFLGSLYQVHDDGTVDYSNRIVTAGDTIIPVTNRNRLVAYVPLPNVFGLGNTIGSNFVYFLRDTHDALSDAVLSFVDIQGVNDVPVALPRVHEVYAHNTLAGITAAYFDDDKTSDTLTGYITRLPQHGTLYRVSPNGSWNAPQHEITAADNWFTSSSLVYVYPLGSVGAPFDSWDWYISDGQSQSATVTDIIHARDVNDPPNPVCPSAQVYDSTGHPIHADGNRAPHTCSPTHVVVPQDTGSWIVLGATDDTFFPFSSQGLLIRFVITAIPANGLLLNSDNQIITQDMLPFTVATNFYEVGWPVAFLPNIGYWNTPESMDSFRFTVHDERTDQTGQVTVGKSWPEERTVHIQVRPTPIEHPLPPPTGEVPPTT